MASIITLRLADGYQSGKFVISISRDDAVANTHVVLIMVVYNFQFSHTMCEITKSIVEALE
jgi:hypothetical protein